MEEFDYVIVGAGTAGSVLARRLSEDPDVRVLVLEAGDNFVPTNVDVAPLWFTLLGSPVDWGYTTVPQPGLNGRTIYEPRGKLPGGSSNLYIMMHIRGHFSDFDNWAYQGAAGWSYGDLAPYFAKLDGTTHGFTRYDVTATRLDASFVRVDGTFNDNFSINLNAMNLLDETYLQYLGQKDMIAGKYKSGRRYMASLHFEF